MVVRCTRRLLDQLGGRALTLTDLPPTDEDWYANLLWLDRKKCLLLTHAGTLFSAFLAGVRTADLRPLGPYVVNAIEAELRSENLPPDTFGRLHPDAVRLAKTASRSTLGFMNEMAVHLRYEVADAGGLSHCNSSALNHHLRRTLHNRGGYVTRSSSLPNGLLRAPERSTRALDMTPESGPALAFSPQPLRHPSRERCLSRKPLRLGRRRLKRLERADVRGRDFQGHLAGIDRPDLLTRHVPDLGGLPGLDGQAVEDVALLIAFDLRDRAEDDAIGSDHVPPLRDLQPRDRISHPLATLAPRSGTNRCPPETASRILI